MQNIFALANTLAYNELQKAQARVTKIEAFIQKYTGIIDANTDALLRFTKAVHCVDFKIKNMYSTGGFITQDYDITDKAVIICTMRIVKQNKNIVLQGDRIKAAFDRAFAGKGFSAGTPTIEDGIVSLKIWIR